MPKSIYFTDDRYEQIVAAARACGFRVQRGRGSQLSQYVVWASNKACSGLIDEHAEKAAKVTKSKKALPAVSR